MVLDRGHRQDRADAGLQAGQADQPGALMRVVDAVAMGVVLTAFAGVLAIGITVNILKDAIKGGDRGET